MSRVVISLAMKKGLLSIKNAAEILGVSTRTLVRWDASGKLKAARHPINNYRIYNLAALQKMAKNINKDG